MSTFISSSNTPRLEMRDIKKRFGPTIALDGVSLTVNEVDGTRFGANLIPHTLQATTFGGLCEGDLVNLEVDILARYVARLMG